MHKGITLDRAFTCTRTDSVPDGVSLRVKANIPLVDQLIQQINKAKLNFDFQLHLPGREVYRATDMLPVWEQLFHLVSLFESCPPS